MEKEKKKVTVLGNDEKAFGLNFTRWYDSTQLLGPLFFSMNNPRLWWSSDSERCDLLKRRDIALFDERFHYTGVRGGQYGVCVRGVGGLVSQVTSGHANHCRWWGGWVTVQCVTNGRGGRRLWRWFELKEQEGGKERERERKKKQHLPHCISSPNMDVC